MEREAIGNIRVVLVGTTHPGNIGAVARAMKTMRLSRLYLVNPKRFPCAEATARAAGADDILYRAVVTDSLESALRDCGWVVATSARTRSIPWPEFGPAEWAEVSVARAQQQDIALVFGREHSGLTNAELDRCQAVVRIPTNPAFHSLNVASAVQILAYELHKAVLGGQRAKASFGDGHVPVSTADMEGFYQHLETALQDVGYLDPEKPKHLMRRLRRLFGRTEPDRSELNILRGILSAAQKAAKD